MKKSFMTILSICLLLLPITINATNERATLSCPKTTVAPGEEITCEVGVANEGQIMGAQLSITTTDNLTLQSSEVNTSAFQGNSESGMFQVTNQDPYDNAATIGTITIKVSDTAEIGSTATITASDVKVTTDNDTEVDGSDGTLDLTIGESGSSEVEPSSENPKTMDTNTFVILGLLSAGLVTMIISRKKLVKIGK